MSPSNYHQMPLTGQLEYLRRQALGLEAVARYRRLDHWERKFAEAQARHTWKQYETLRKQNKGN